MADGGLKAVFLQNRPMLLRLLVARLGNREDAEDTLQDMWMRIDQLISQPIFEPAAFLYRVAANLATDRRLAATRRGARETHWLDVQPLAEDIPDTERAAIARDRLRTIERTIAAMPERMSTALRMFRLEERSQRSIAEHLGISVSGVEKLLQRAHRRIQEIDSSLGEDSVGPYRLGEEGRSGRAD